MGFNWAYRSGAGLESPNQRPGLCGLNLSTDTKGESVPGLIPAHPDHGEKRGKQRGQTQEQSVIEHQKWSQALSAPT